MKAILIMDEMIYYGLEGQVITLQEWAEQRILARDKVGNYTISTVLLGVDYRFNKHDGLKPIIFETIIFKDDDEDYLERYSTKEEALEGHKLAVKEAKRLTKLKK